MADARVRLDNALSDRYQIERELAAVIGADRFLALVADFGIALAVSSAASSSRITETGMSLGTPRLP